MTTKTSNNKEIPVGSFLRKIAANPIVRRFLLTVVSIAGEKAIMWMTKKLKKEEPTGFLPKEKIMHYFSETSKERLATCHVDLQTLMNEAIKFCPIDFGISEGHRSVERQQELFKQIPPVTSIDGINTLSKHNYKPSKAVDIYAWVNGKLSYNMQYMAFVGGYIMALADRLYLSGEIAHKIRWGGNWDGDGEIITDQTLVDLPHFEIME